MRDWVQGAKFIDHNLKTEICTSQFSAQNRICRQQFEVCKANDKTNSVQNLMTELELYTEFVSHNLVHKTEFVDNNLKFVYEMTMEFND